MLKSYSKEAVDIAERFGISVEEASRDLAEQEVHMEMDGDMDVFDLIDEQSIIDNAGL